MGEQVLALLLKMFFFVVVVVVVVSEEFFCKVSGVLYSYNTHINIMRVYIYI